MNFNSSYKLSLLASVFVPFSVFVDEQKKTLPMGRDRHSRHLKKCRYAGGNTQDTVSECLLITSGKCHLSFSCKRDSCLCSLDVGG